MKNLFILFAILFSLQVNSQEKTAKIKGTINDSLTQAPIPFCNYYLYQNGEYTGIGGQADTAGRYLVSNLSAGDYIIEFSDLDHPSRQYHVTVGVGQTRQLYPELSGNVLPGPVIRVFPDLVNTDEPTSTRVKAKDLENLPTRNLGVNRIVADATPGVTQDERTGAIYFRGARDGSTMYVIDGVKTREPGMIPAAAIKEIRTLSSGIPAEFGDVTGGVVYITTKSGI